MTFDWTEERIETLKKLHAMGMRARIIGERLGGATKSKILGKLSRLGLSKPRQRAKASPRPRKGSPVRSKPFRPVYTPPPVDPPRPIPAAPNSQPCDLMGLTNWTCRWPITETGPHLFCGAPEADNANGQPYCPAHAIAAFNRRGAE